jgi:hypothetical protein
MICGPRKSQIQPSAVDYSIACERDTGRLAPPRVKMQSSQYRVATTLMFVSFTVCTTFDGKIYNRDQIDLRTIKFFATSELR